MADALLNAALAGAAGGSNGLRDTGPSNQPIGAAFETLFLNVASNAAAIGLAALQRRVATSPSQLVLNASLIPYNPAKLLQTPAQQTSEASASQLEAQKKARTKTVLYLSIGLGIVIVIGLVVVRMGK